MKELKFGFIGMSQIKEAQKHLEDVKSCYRNKSCYFEQAHTGDRIFGGWYSTYHDIASNDMEVTVNEYNNIDNWLETYGYATIEECLENGNVEITKYFSEHENETVYELYSYGEQIFTVDEDEVLNFAIKSQADGRGQTKMTYIELVNAVDKMTSLENIDEVIIKFVLEKTPYIFVDER